MKPIHHGGNVDAAASQLHLSPSDILDFSANINPLGFPKLLLPIFKNVSSLVTNYPDPRYQKLKRSLAQHYGLSVSDIFVANGGTQLLDEAIRAVHAPEALILAPTFGEYEQMFSRLGTHVHHFRLTANNNFQPDVDQIMTTLKDQSQITAICLTNPNNPTGSLVSPADLRRLVNFCNRNRKTLILDEAFIDLTINDQQTFIPQLTAADRVIVARSATKLFAIPGLRLGYGVTKNRHLQQQMAKQEEDWSVNAIADKFGQQMYTAKSYLEQTKDWLTREQPHLWQALAKIPQLTVYPSQANFILFHCERRDLRELLMKKRILIRQCDDYVGLGPEFYRVAVRSSKENAILVKAIQQVLEGG